MIKKLFTKIFKSNKVEVISFQQGFDLTSMPIVTFYQGENKFNFVLDTGSNSNVIDSNILGCIKHEKLDTTSTHYGVEGNKKSVDTCKIVITYKDKVYEDMYLITDMKKAFDGIKQTTGVTLHGLIGSKFFNKYKYVLDFDELIAYSKA
jgi:hypothetical protein